MKGLSKKNIKKIRNIRRAMKRSNCKMSPTCWGLERDKVAELNGRRVSRIIKLQTGKQD